MDELIARLERNEPLPICPFDRRSPVYWTTPDDKPCPFCGQENTADGPDKCRGADTRLFGEAAAALRSVDAEIKRLKEAIVWALGYTDFRERQNGEGAYWWRKELREKSGMTHADCLAALNPSQGTDEVETPQ